MSKVARIRAASREASRLCPPDGEEVGVRPDVGLPEQLGIPGDEQFLSHRGQPASARLGRLLRLGAGSAARSTLPVGPERQLG